MAASGSAAGVTPGAAAVVSVIPLWTALEFVADVA